MLCSEIQYLSSSSQKFQFSFFTVLSMINGDDDKEFEDSEEVNCLPNLADRCFSDIYTNLACHLDPTTSPYCKKRDVNDLCR
jgi:hypothetical protein